MAQQNSLVGHMLGQYQIVELIGEGGMATVYKAWQPSLRREVALKVLAPHLSDDAQFVKRFHQEAVSAANLKHTHIVTIHDVGTESGYHYIAMEFIEGTSLEERIRSGQAFAPEQVVDVISQVGSALDYAHQRGFIHRDIKPANVLIDASGRAVLTDFGIVKALSGSGVTSPLTQAGTVFGTPQYMSPEQVKDEPLDHRSDLYSLGIVCYEMLSGQVPFDGTTTHSILYAQVNNPPPPLREFAGLDVPAPVEGVVEKMLAKERSARYDSAGEFARDLAQAVAGVWPAGMGGETAVVGGMGTGTAVIGGTPPGIPPASRAPTVRQPMGPPTPPATVWQPTGPPTPAPVPAPARRSRWPLILGAVAVGAGVLLILAVVGVLVLGIENPLKGIQVARDLRDAQAALDVGDYAGAAEGFSQALESDPESVEAIDGLLEAAANLAQAGQFDTTISVYETVLQVEPGEVQALRGLGQTYAAKGEWGEAASWYEKWTQAAPEDGSAFLALGSARFNLEEYERVVAAYERAGALDASSVEMDAHLGLAYFELAQYEEAVGHLQNAVGQTPEDFQSQRALGLAYFELARYEEAVGHLQNAVGQTPEDFQLQRALGVSLYTLGQYEQAVEHLDKAVALGVERSDRELMDVYYALGGSYMEKQDYEPAINFYEQAQQLDPEGKAVWADEAQANLDEAYSRLAERVMNDALLDLDFSDIVTEGDRAYGIAKTGQRAEIEGPVQVVSGPWEGSQALVVEEDSTIVNHNPLLNGQYSKGLAPACFLGGDVSSITPSESTLYTQYSGRSQKLVFSGSTESTPYFRQDGEYLPSTQYSVRVRLYIESLTTSVRVRIYDGSRPLDTDLTTTGWHEVRETFTSPATIENERILVYPPINDSATVYVDVIAVEPKPYVTTPFDGDSGIGYSWGPNEPHADASMRQATRCEIDAAGTLDYASDHTVLVWMKLYHGSGAGPMYPAVFHYGQYDTNNSISLMFYRDGDALQLYAKDNAGLWHQRGAVSNPAPDADDYEADTWYMLGYRYYEVDNRVDLIWDGQIAEQNSGTAWPSADNTYHRLGIGCRPDGNDNWSDGAVGMVAVFPRALTATEVVALYWMDMSASR
jgi:tetratricopeptide (TPR) repeat protein